MQMELKYDAKQPTSKKGMPREMFLPWGGWFPHPELDRDIERRPWKVSEEQKQTLATIPAAIQYFVPSGIGLSTFRKHKFSRPESQSLASIDAHVSLEKLLKSVANEDKKLISKKPLDGVYAYIWRVARYVAGLDRAIPITAFWDLEDGVLALTGVLGVTEETVKFLGQRADELVEATGGNKYAAQVRWSRFLGRAV